MVEHPVTIGGGILYMIFAGDAGSTPARRGVQDLSQDCDFCVGQYKYEDVFRFLLKS